MFKLIVIFVLQDVSAQIHQHSGARSARSLSRCHSNDSATSGPVFASADYIYRWLCVRQSFPGLGSTIYLAYRKCALCGMRTDPLANSDPQELENQFRGRIACVYSSKLISDKLRKQRDMAVKNLLSKILYRMELDPYFSSPVLSCLR